MFKFRKPSLRISNRGKVSLGGAGLSIGGKHVKTNVSASGVSETVSGKGWSYNTRRGFRFNIFGWLFGGKR